MNRKFSALILAVISLSATSIAFADTAAGPQSIENSDLQPGCQVARLQMQVNTLTGEVASLQTRTVAPSASENVIDNLATGG